VAYVRLVDGATPTAAKKVVYERLVDGATPTAAKNNINSSKKWLMCGWWMEQHQPLRKIECRLKRSFILSAFPNRFWERA